MTQAPIRTQSPSGYGGRRDDRQRRAMFANMEKMGLLGKAGAAVGRGIHKGQAKVREFSKKRPFTTELLIGIPVAAAGIYGARKLRGIKALGQWATKGGTVKGGTMLRNLALEAPVFGAADYALRRTTMGKYSERKGSEAGLVKMFAGAGLAEVGYRVLHNSNSRTRRSMSYLASKGSTIRQSLPFGTAGRALGRGIQSAGRALATPRGVSMLTAGTVAYGITKAKNHQNRKRRYNAYSKSYLQERGQYRP